MISYTECVIVVNQTPSVADNINRFLIVPTLETNNKAMEEIDKSALFSALYNDKQPCISFDARLIHIHRVPRSTFRKCLTVTTRPTV